MFSTILTFQNGGPLTNYRSKLWPDILNGLTQMYRFQAFAGLYKAVLDREEV